jgi:hypothetical protein
VCERRCVALFTLRVAIQTIESAASEPVRQTKDMVARYATGDAVDPYGWPELACDGDETARLHAGLSFNGRALDPHQYLLSS